MVRRTVHYSGRVQCVGFRACTASLAKNHDVAGTVQNTADGRVRVVVQGSADDVRAFFTEIERELGHHIRGAVVVDERPDGAFGDPHALNAFRVLR